MNAAFTKADANKDGKLDKVEFKTYLPEQMQSMIDDERLAQIVTLRDTNKDGFLSKKPTAPMQRPRAVSQQIPEIHHMTIKYLALAATALVLTAPSFAQRGPQMTPEEREAAFVKADANKDGKLDKAELKNDPAGRIPGPGRRRASRPMLTRRDADKDGFVSKAEYHHASAAPGPISSLRAVRLSSGRRFIRRLVCPLVGLRRRRRTRRWSGVSCRLPPKSPPGYSASRSSRSFGR